MEMITYLKRRFSSGDLQGEAADKREQEGLPSFLRFGSTTSGQAINQPSQTYQPNSIQQHPSYKPEDTRSTTGFNAATGAPSIGMFQPSTGPISANRTPAVPTADDTATSMRRPRGTFPSAPTSPTRIGSFMGPMSNITGQISTTIMRGLSTAASTAQSMTTGKSGPGKHQQKVLLVIDDSQTDWCKYFKGQKIFGDWDIGVEQAQFSEITMTAYSDHGCVINVHPGSGSTKIVRSFKPDFVLLRQHASGTTDDWQPILTGLMYAGTPCMNTLHAIYNMKNRPWLFAHLLMLRNRLGKDAFPLITQVYHTNHTEMITAPVFPTIVKVGIGYGGDGKIRADTQMSFQDITSLLVHTNTYATIEPFVDAKCDVHVQRIGTQYKAFVRKSISGHWKTNVGPAILEKVPINDRFKLWVDEVARMFGGLDLCSVEALQSKTGEYYIYEVNGSDMTLFGDSQEEDRSEIADLVVKRMQTVCAPTSTSKTSTQPAIGRSPESEHSNILTTPNQPQYQTFPTTRAYTSPSQTQSLRPMAQSSQPRTAVSEGISTGHVTTSPYPNFWHSPPDLSTAQTTNTFGTHTSISASSKSVWSDHAPLSGNVNPSTGSSFSMSVTSKLDGLLPSGLSTPTASLTSETEKGSAQSTSDSAFLSNAPPFTPSSVANYTSSSVTWSPGIGYSSVGADRSLDRDRGSQRPFFGSNDAFDKMVSGQSIDRRMESPSMSSVQTFDGQVPDRSHSVSTSQIPGSGLKGYPSVPARQTSLRSSTGPEDSDDTMKHLRKTFAGIFGDM